MTVVLEVDGMPSSSRLAASALCTKVRLSLYKL